MYYEYTGKSVFWLKPTLTLQNNILMYVIILSVIMLHAHIWNI